jgi:hypothetical protein
MARLTVFFLSMQSSTIYSATLSLQSEVTAQASVAQQGISSLLFLTTCLLRALVPSFGWSLCLC